MKVKKKRKVSRKSDKGRKKFILVGIIVLVVFALLFIMFKFFDINNIFLSPGETVVIEWSKTFDYSGSETAYSLQQTTDGGYILGGIGNANVNSLTGLFVKTDSSGGLEWYRNTGVTASNPLIRYVQQTSGGYVATGEVVNGASGIDTFIYRINLTGGFLSYHTIGGTGNSAEYGKSIQQTNDGGYIIVGSTSQNNGDLYLIKRNSDGSSGGTPKKFGGSSDDGGNSVQQVGDGYIIVGYTTLTSRDAWLMKTDLNRMPVWNKTFGESGSDEGKFVKQISDGYIIAGVKNGSTWLMKTDSSGNMVWEKTYGVGEGYSVQQVSDGYLVTSSNMGLIKTDLSGNIEWNRSVENGAGYAAQGTNDGGYILSGAKQNGPGSMDMLLVKYQKIIVVCGNNNVEPGEQCDDGNQNNNDGCSSTCQIEPPRCGDGRVNQQSEQCDDGNLNGQSCSPPYGGSCTYCSASCLNVNLPGGFCGDQIVNGPEICDSNTASCTTANGYTGTQQCNPSCSGFDACTSTQSCGDGVLNGNEVCDDGSLNGQIGHCNAQCNGVITTGQDYYKVFVTSQGYNGNLGGLSGADAKCQQLANAAGMSPRLSWKAWLSDSATSASQRLFHSNLAYKRMDGATVADSWADLTDGSSLDNFININEFSILASNIIWVYTGTNPDGSSSSFFAGLSRSWCDDWTSNLPEELATIGFVNSTSENGWTRVTGAGGCQPADIYDLGLYCFQQPSCGNAIVENGEGCDDGNLIDGDGCTNTCLLGVNSVCGNNVVEAGEDCDNGPSGLSASNSHICSPTTCKIEGWHKILGADSNGINSAISEIIQNNEGDFVNVHTISSPGYNGLCFTKNLNNGSFAQNFGYCMGNFSRGNSIKQTNDGGYILAGRQTNQILLKKQNSNGNDIWTKTYPTQGSVEEAFAVEQTSDGGYILTAYRSGGYSLLKTTSDGTLQWRKDDVGGEDVVEANDGGYVFVARNSTSFNHTTLGKTDSSGNLQWTRNFEMEYVNFVAKTNDGGYVIGGNDFIGLNPAILRNLIIKTDVNGNYEWENLHIGDITLTDVKQTSDGGYIIVTGANRLDIYKLDSNGNKIWEKILPPSIITPGKRTMGRSVQETNDGGYIIGGSIKFFGTDEDAWVVRLFPLPAGCGNGIREGTETCDDYNNVGGDGCSVTCSIEPYTMVFVTSQTWNGNLGGVAGADAKCQQAAANVPAFAGSYWRAWISDNLGNTASSRLYHETKTYRSLGDDSSGGNRIIANNWNDLVDGTLRNPINVDEFGNTLSAGEKVWTGTTLNGNVVGAGNCMNWVTTAANGATGLASSLTSSWTNAVNTPCTTAGHLYCVMQPAPVCGNGILEVGEGCEPIGKITTCSAGGVAGKKVCGSNCQWGTCVKNPPTPGGPCFLPDTRITTNEGKKEIKDIKEGDEVISYNEVSKKIESNKVSQVFTHVTDGYLLINGKLKVTSNHPMMINGKWMEIGRAIVGDKLMTEKGEEKITSIKEVKGSFEVYNLEIENDHTYYAEGYLAHNKGPIPPGTNIH